MSGIINEWSKLEERSVIRFLWAKGIPTMEIHKDLVNVYGPNVMTVQSDCAETMLMTVQRQCSWLCRDNARPHTANATVDLLKSWKWEILPHPPYSPDLAPSDFHLFPQLKKYLRGNHFQSSEDVKDAVHQWIRRQSPSFYYRGLDSLILRYDKCLNRLGDYVEK